MSQTINTVPTAGSDFLEALQAFLENEDANRFGLYVPYGLIVAGGIHGAIAGLTATPSALVALPSGYYITETGSITYPDSSTIWVIANKDTVGNLGAYTRVAGTHYLIAAVGVAPTLPPQCVRLMKVTTAAGAITTVQDLRNFSAVQVAGINPFVRLIGLEASGLDYAIQEVAGALIIGVNTQTQDNPLHTSRFRLVPDSVSELVLDASTITANRAQVFPDKSGTFAMTSDIAGSAFAAGTRMLFDQAAAPTGWVRDVTIDDKVVRIVGGARADGGSWTVSGLTAAGHAITIAEMPAHTHAAPNGAAFSTTDPLATQVSGAGPGGVAATTDTTGSGNQHTHNVASDATWRPLHRDVIVCQKS